MTDLCPIHWVRNVFVCKRHCFLISSLQSYCHQSVLCLRLCNIRVSNMNVHWMCQPRVPSYHTYTDYRHNISPKWEEGVRKYWILSHRRTVVAHELQRNIRVIQILSINIRRSRTQKSKFTYFCSKKKWSILVSNEIDELMFWKKSFFIYVWSIMKKITLKFFFEMYLWTPISDTIITILPCQHFCVKIHDRINWKKVKSS